MHAHERLEPHAEVDDLRTSPRPKKFQYGTSWILFFPFCYSSFVCNSFASPYLHTLYGVHTLSLWSPFLILVQACLGAYVGGVGVGRLPTNRMH